MYGSATSLTPLILGLSLSTTLLCLDAHAQSPTDEEPVAKGQRFPEMKLHTLDGDELDVASTWKEGPAVVVMLRGYPGYQCPLCTRQVAELLQQHKAFTRANATLLFIYPGNVQDLRAKAKEFANPWTLPKGVHLVVDSDYEATARLNLRWDAKGETAYPATILVDKQGVIQWSHVSRSHGDRVASKQILDQIR